MMHVESPDGTTIACHVAGAGPPLVLVHGTTADHTRWNSVLEPLAAHHTVYAVDRRGRGESSDAEPYAIEREFEDIAAVVDAIGGPVDLLGHSYGAICSLEATLRSGAVRKLVLYEPPLPIGIEIYPPALLDALTQQLEAGDREGVITTFFTKVVRMPAAEVEALRAESSWPGRVAAAHTIPRELRIQDEYTPDFDRFAQVDVPTLLLVGSDSPPFLVEPSRRLGETIPNARLETMAGQQHTAMTMAPELFVGLVSDFVSGR
jgi:pimeloyl-ACP methyl ester carboxylesterase